MADNETSIALPEQTDEVDGVLTGAVQAADQQVQTGSTAEPTAPQGDTPAAASSQAGGGGTAQPLGLVVNTQ
ncbi:hypothetical protein OG455_15950 [Kitasatospora sp. NBC_01287]|uniref:hypothetical protein n=1 Tax=Kitasatospora sp. NBC_01287 TaxID=2903573 RepID=UPI002257586A|nr:hypothetical protein [Kitasatospora sp. NBC_01287]MCX4747001.1 hypothetical protein [Kitasatospora sp. NBC_01287]